MIDIDISKRFSAATEISAKFVSDASVLALFGRSGSGKTTVVSAVAGLVKADRGHIRIDGVTLFDSEHRINMPVEQRGIGYVFQDGLLFPHLTVRQNLDYGARRSASVDRKGAPIVPFDQVVDLLGIGALMARDTPSLSGGEKQRVAIGRALLSRPRLLLMDEPIASLDSGRRSEILRLIERVRDEFGMRIVYVSHSIGEVSRLADDVVLMNDGKVVACAPTEEIFNRADLRPYTGRFEGGALIEAHAVRHDMKYFLTTFKFDGGELIAPGVDTPIGARVRIRIRARDVTLATERPRGISIRNILEGTVGAIDNRGGAIAEVHVRLTGSGGSEPRELLSRISAQALDEMQLETGQPIYALIKAIAFDKRSMGFTAQETVFDRFSSPF
ncbi:MAG: molybdenum ABC transporter ATP-binding protein [Casimicrobium sp.]